LQLPKGLSRIAADQFREHEGTDQQPGKRHRTGVPVIHVGCLGMSVTVAMVMSMVVTGVIRMVIVQCLLPGLVWGRHRFLLSGCRP
jgi:hypothetical protein